MTQHTANCAKYHLHPSADCTCGLVMVLSSTVLRSLAASIALSDDMGDVHEALDKALSRSGLPPVPTDAQGRMECSGWLIDTPHVWELDQT